MKPAPSDLLSLVLDRFVAEGVELSVTQIVAYLYICENEGLNLTELASVMQVTNQVASYTVRGLLDAGAERAIEPAVGLVRMEPSEIDARALAFFLTPRGLRMRQQLDELIADGCAI